MPDEEFDAFKSFVVTSSYFRRNDHMGGSMMPGAKHYHRDGTEHTIEHVSWNHLLAEVEKEIKSNVPEARRTEVFRRVMGAIPGGKKTAEWERTVVNPNEKPETPFSASRAVRVSLHLPLCPVLCGLMLDSGIEEVERAAS